MSSCLCVCNLNFFDRVKIWETSLQDILTEVTYNYSLHVRKFFLLYDIKWYSNYDVEM
jgi:hypothetical protein